METIVNIAERIKYLMTKSIFKKNISSILLCLICTSICGQTESQLRKYFEDNISTLDPIEGIYDVELKTIPRNSFRVYDADVITDNYQVFVYRDGNKFVRYNPKSGNTTGEYVRSGETNAYTLTIPIANEKIRVRTILQDKTILRYEFNHPTTDKEYARIFLKRGNYVVYKGTEIKTYPTPSMYAQKNINNGNTTPQTWTGTGFALNNSYIVTNFHVVENAKDISIQGINGDFSVKYLAKVIAVDRVNDIAILTTICRPPFTNVPYSVKTSMSEVGEDIFVLGYPLTATMGEEIKLTTGVISSKTGFQGDVSIYQISAPVQPGNSGGPLFDRKGNVIGIVSAKHNGAENVTYAVKTSYLKNLIESTSLKNILPSDNSIANMSLSGKVKVLTKYVYYITCSK
jgi:S1-C subfamily serine protease